MSTESILEQYRVHDFVNWYRNKELTLNPFFQRRSVWLPQAKTLLIDSILRKMPIPKIYMRTKIDTRAKTSIREVVDGQQRLRAILDFADDRLILTKHAREYAGFKYSNLPSDLQEEFLSYPLAVDSLVNASDSDVLEVFARLNSYTVSLNPAEKRHAKYQGDFKWSVHNSAYQWKTLWEDYGVIPPRKRIRMGDDSFMAELYGIIINGVTDGGEPAINKLYDSQDRVFNSSSVIVEELNTQLHSLLDNYGDLINHTEICRSPQFLMLFAAYCSMNLDLPQGQLKLKAESDSIDSNSARDRLSLLASVLDSENEEYSAEYTRFVAAGTKSTQRIATRRIRFSYYRWAFSNTEQVIDY